ncbi:MAG: dihydrofolate reductase, partial [Chloroflexi bacterium]|nr:dihydrofolate reductase [Chloroflexota bacterium]
MSGKVFFSVSMSLDGFVAPEGRMGEPRWMGQWMELQQWLLGLRFFRENLMFVEGGEEGRDNE